METKFNIIKIKEFAREIKTPESTIRTWKRRGEIPENCFLVIGSTVFVKVEEIQQWIKKTVWKGGGTNDRQISQE